VRGANPYEAKIQSRRGGGGVVGRMCGGRCSYSQGDPEMCPRRSIARRPASICLDVIQAGSSA